MGPAVVDGFDLSGIAAVNILLIGEQKKHRATPRTITQGLSVDTGRRDANVTTGTHFLSGILCLCLVRLLSLCQSVIINS